MEHTFFTEQTSVEAGRWLARLHGGELSAEDEAAFRLWLASDPANASAFEHATSVWDKLGAVSRDCFVAEERPKFLPSRRAFVVGSVSACAVVSSIAFMRSAKAKTYQTAVGEQARISLADGSGLFLDTNTSLTVDLSGNRRLVDLKYGRVNCRVAQSQAPFAVRAGDSVVVGEKSVFDVFRTGEYFSVVLINGNAELTRSATTKIDLRQGDRVAGMESSSLQRDRPDLAILTAWQGGRLVFKDQSVAEAIQEVNRYSELKIEVVDPDIAAMHMSGGYVVGDPVGFAMSLSRLLPVQVRVLGNKIELVGTSKV